MILFIRWKRWITGFFILAILGIFLFFWIGRLVISKSLPELSGEILAEGIYSQTEVFRDGFGVPHIIADNEHDLMFIEGYVHAQDRLWQMDFYRRAATGELSEVFGSRTLSLDRTMRTIGIHVTAKKIADSMNASTRSLLQAYCDGINHFIFTHVDNLPDEFVLREYKPGTWEVEHCVAVSRLVAWMLNMAWYVDLAYDEIIDSVGYRKAREIFPVRSDDRPAIVPDWKFKGRWPGAYSDTLFSAVKQQHKDIKKTSSEFAAHMDLFRELTGVNHFWSGSNNWVIHGRKTAGGKPLIANDPHLAVMFPGLWYEIHLSGGDLNVSGFGIPGLPFVVIGNNQRIAWAFTNGMLDETDIYLETVNDQQYRFNGLWKPLLGRTERIAVKDSSDEEFTVYSTHRGPIISAITARPLKENKALSMRWMGNDVSDEFHAFNLINRAKNWDEFRNAAKFYRVPGQNALYADVDGNIGYLCLGAVPLRRDGNYFSVVDGSSGLYDWRGFLNPDDLPYLLNPDQSYIATANNPIAGDQDRFYFSAYWEPNSRIKRIQRIIESKNIFTSQDCRDLQLDLYSIHAEELLPYLLRACESDTHIAATPGEPGELSRYQESYLLLKYWNNVMESESQPALLFNEFYRRLLFNTFHDEMGDTLYSAFVKLTAIPIRAMQSLLPYKSSDWWNNKYTSDSAETRDAVLRQSFIDAVDSLYNRTGKAPAALFWKNFHYVQFSHPFGSVFPLNHYFNPQHFHVPGNATTVNKSEFDFASPGYQVTVMPSFRRIVDLTNIQTSYSIVPAGQSGQPASPFYYDQFNLWNNGLMKTISMDVSVIRTYSNHLIFKPR